MFEMFVREWGTWSVSVLSLGVAALAYLNSRRALRIASTAHDWKAEDRAREVAARKAVEDRRTWCQYVATTLRNSRGDNSFPIHDDKPEWAKWGEDNGYFGLEDFGGGLYAVRG